MGGDPNGRMGLLVGFGSGEGLVELPVFALGGDRVLRPRLDNDLERLSRHLMPLLKGQVPAQEFVPYDPRPRAEFQPPVRQLVQRCQVLGQTDGVMKGQLVNHQAEPQGAGATRQGSEVNIRSGHGADRRILVLDKEVVAVPELLGLLCLTNMGLVHLHYRRKLLHLEGTEGVKDAKF